MADLNEIMEIINKTVQINLENNQNTAAIIKKMNEQEAITSGLINGVKVLSNGVNRLDENFTTLNNRMDNLELNEEITTEQVNTINSSARRRVSSILGDNLLEHSKYFKTFICRLYSDAKRNAGMGSSISTTKKCNFQRCIDYIESWIPSCGCLELKKQVDQKAKANLEAKEQGYKN